MTRYGVERTFRFSIFFKKINLLRRSIWALPLLLLSAGAGRAQTVVEFAIPSSGSQPNFITAGPDGNLWFLENAGNRVARITTGGVITEFAALPTAFSGPTAIAAGPDGALWFAEFGHGAIGRISTAGALSEFIVPTAGSEPSGIALGADGNLWFTELAFNKIGRITSGGTITEFRLAGSANGFDGIANGPDGNLWFTEFNDNRIDKVTTGGVITEVGTIPTAQSSPQRIATGSDGNLWFTENAGDQIGRITPGGTVTEFALPTFGAPSDITAGPDGALWYTDTGTNRIGRITTAGAISEFPIQTSIGNLIGLTTGPDGALWFVEEGANKIGRLLPSPSVALVSAVLPISRSVAVNATATAFATIINASSATATACRLSPSIAFTGTFGFQTTDAATNAVTGQPNMAVDIPAGAAQSFIFSFTPTAALSATDVPLNFFCTNSDGAAVSSGLNTLLLSASTTPVPDVIALVASSDPGIVDIPGATGTGAFAVATFNLGASASITATADTGSANLPVSLTLCETNPTTGQCLAAPASSVTTTIANGATPTFAVFVTGAATVPFSPGSSRIFVRFADTGAVVRGATSVAVRTQ